MPTTNAFGLRAHDSRGASDSRAPTTAAIARPAAMVSAVPGLSVSSRPLMNEMPEVLAMTQPMAAPPLISTPARMTRRCGFSRAATPQPICSTAMITKVTDAALASLCAPAAVAWMAPAPREANAAAASTAGRAAFSVVVDDDPVSVSPDRGSSSGDDSLGLSSVNTSGSPRVSIRQECRPDRRAEHTAYVSAPTYLVRQLGTIRHGRGPCRTGGFHRRRSGRHRCLRGPRTARKGAG